MIKRRVAVMRSIASIALALGQVSLHAQGTIAAAWDFSAAIYSDGTLWTWGNGSDALGLGSSVWSTNRPALVGSATNWVAVFATYEQCLALRADGTLWAWGWNGYGQLGLGDNVSRDSPTQVGTDTNWVRVSAAASFCAAVRSDGSLWTWGDNWGGMLGLGHDIGTNLPARVGNDTDWTTVSATLSHCLALRADGSLWAWGDGYSGRLGLGDLSSTNVPTRVGNDTDWIAVAAGDDHSLALRSDGTLWAWGRNWSGELGIIGIAGTNVPVRVGTETNWIAISAGGGEHSMALQSDGSLWAWGGNKRGQCGLGFASYAVLTPTRIGTGTNWVAIAAGADHSVALRSDGSLWASGSNENDALGTDTSGGSFTTVVRRVLKSRWRTPAGTLPAGKVIGLDGDLDFGEVPLTQNAQGALNIFNDGDTAFTVTSISHSAPEFSGTTNGTIQPGACFSATIACAPSVPGYVSGTLSVHSDATGGEATLAETAAGGPALDFATDVVGHALSTDASTPWRIDTTIHHDGTDSARSGPIADGASSTMETRIFGPSEITFWWKVSSESSGDYLRCYVDGASQWEISGEVGWEQKTLIIPIGWHTIRWTYFKNASGASGSDAGFVDQLAISPTSPPMRPSFSAGEDHSAAIAADGSLWAWGDGSDGQLGIPDDERDAPARVGSETNWAQVAAGENFTLAIRTDGTLWAWGDNDYGQLGLGDKNERDVPTRVGSASNWVTVEVAWEHSIGIRSDGTLWAWGQGALRRLGLEEPAARWLPTRVGTNTDWIAVASQEDHCLAIRANGTLWAWGRNSEGELGLGDDIDRLTPAQVGTDTNWAAIATGDSRSFALRSDGTLWAWGANWNGILGLGDTVHRYTPTRIGSSTNWVSITAGGEHTLAIRSDGTLWSWGENNQGQLGLGDFEIRTVPVRFGTATNWFAASGGKNNHSLALRSDGSLWSAGSNDEGQLGLGPEGRLNEPLFARITGPRWRAAGAPSPSGRVIGLAGNLAFGPVFLGMASQRTLTIFSDGDQPLTITSISHEDPEFTGDFSGIIPAGQYTNVTVTFTPTTTDQHIATLTVASDAIAGDPVFDESGSGRATIPLGDALDAPALTWTIAGHAVWYGLEDAEVSHDAADTASSGDIDDNQTSSLQTSVTGPGRIQFWWKVSSERYYDCLEFYIDDLMQAGISGYVDWQQIAYDIPQGSHTLEWRFSKDDSVTERKDAGWVDEVGWTPGNTTALWTAIHFSGEERGDPDISGFWADPDRDEISNGIEAVLGLNPRDGSGANGMSAMPLATRIGSGANSHMAIRFAVAHPPFLDVRLRVQASGTLLPGSWVTIAQKTGNDPWTGAATVTENPLPDGRIDTLVEDNENLADHPRRFLRLVVEQLTD